MSLLAAIDVGSNTLRLLIGRAACNRLIDVYSDRKITRLGNRVGQTGTLQDKNIEVSISALKEFSSVVSSYGVSRVKAVATSALREASNSDIFIKRVFDATGIAIEVITGEKEAELTLKGILLSFPDPESQTLPMGGMDGLLIADIGGGSTEWISYRDRFHIDMGSTPTGVIKLTQDFLKTDPISEAHLIELNGAIDAAIENLKQRIGPPFKEDTKFIGTGGTFTTLASIDLGIDGYSRRKVHLHTIALSELRDMGEKLIALSLEDRKKVKGLEPERADLIIPGIQFTIKLMKWFQFDELIISDYGLIEGALLDIEKDISEAGCS